MTSPEFIKLKNLAKLFDCDAKTLQKVLDKLSESYEIKTFVWNNSLRINYEQFRRAVLEQVNLTF